MACQDCNCGRAEMEQSFNSSPGLMNEVKFNPFHNAIEKAKETIDILTELVRELEKKDCK